MTDKEIELREVSNPGYNKTHSKDGTLSANGTIHQDPVAELPLPILKQHKRKILKNLAVLSLAWLFLFTGYGAIQNLQSSLNKDEGLGTVSVSVIYGSLVLSCMFIPPVLIDALGYKWTIIGSMFCYLVYMLANFYASWYTLIPGAIILGLGAAPAWAAKCAYLTNTGKEYAQLTKDTDAAVITRFFGIFFMVFQLTQVIGNAISSTVLSVPLNPESNSTGNFSIIHEIEDEILEQCGAQYCQDITNNTNLKRPDDRQVYLLMGIYFALGVLAIMIIWIFLDHVDNQQSDSASTDGDGKRPRCSPALLVATFRHLRHPNQLFIIPLTIYSGLEQGFMSGDFTKSYVSCALGINMVGFVMICYGVSDSLFSFLSGKVVKYIGRPACFWAGAVVHFCVQVALVYWKPIPEQLPVFFVLAALWGLSDAIWQTQINALYGCIFSEDEQEAAFANYRMWESVGFIMAFAYSSYICTNMKLFILLSVLGAGMIGYTIIEIKECKRERNSAALEM
ncbi:protein unc-93 homolog A-like [Lineus longissimus]|uniref:protein unc-93 homolog A-like n=1 Tax=Lineus longissimus TaxID=88925 RepID=UPI002B4DE638